MSDGRQRRIRGLRGRPWPIKGLRGRRRRTRQLRAAQQRASRQRIVVGVSGSAASLSALRWAADEARLRGASLHVLRAWDPARHAAPYAAVGYLPTGDEQEFAVRTGFSAALRSVFGTATPAGVTTEVAEGIPERILIARSSGADLLVIGTSSLPWWAGRSVGPVVRACLNRAGCPVVVVAAAGSSTGPAGGSPAPADRGLAGAVTSPRP